MKRLTVGYSLLRLRASLLTLGLSLVLLSINVQADSDTISYRLPDDSKLPAGPEAQAIRLGKALLTDTRRKLPQHVGNGLNCSNCHLGAGTQPHASPWVAAYGERDGKGRVIREFKSVGPWSNVQPGTVNEALLESACDFYPQWWSE